MPIPEPIADEDQEAFHARCMRAVYDEYGQEQGNAICFSQWRKHRRKSIDTGTGLVAYDLQGQRKEASASGSPWRLYGRIEKVEEVGDGTIRVHGIASTEDEDDQGEVVKADAMRAAIPDYMRFASVREMHGLSAAGRALECNCGNDNVTRIVAHVVDPIAVKKVQTRTYNGFSIGGRVLERAPAEHKVITKLQLHEISLVDRPANPRSVIDLWKATDIEPGDRPMPPDGLGTMEAAWADALKKVQQVWACDNPAHRHTAKAEALACLAKAQVGDPQTATDTKAGRAFPNAAPPFHAKDGEPGSNADKVGLPGGGNMPLHPPPGDPNPETNFDGDHDGDDDESSAESAGGGFKPEGEDDRSEDFGKKKNGDGSKPYGNVSYADPGLQSDGKKRYPIDTEAHVRAAWSYINQADNARAYSSENLSRVKAKIRAAARRHGIEISEKAIFDLGDPDALIKSLAGACLDELLEELPYDLDLEVLGKAGRRMAAADSFMMNMAHDAIGKMTDMAFCMKAGATATQDTARNPEHDAPSESTDSGTSHYRLGENATQDTNKRGARHSTATMSYLRKAHDNLCRAGAACPAHADDGMSKAAATTEDPMAVTTDDEGAAVAAALKKAHKRNEKLEDKIAALTTQVSNLTVHMEYLAKGAKGEPPPPAPVPEKAGKIKKAIEPLAAQVAQIAEQVAQIAKQPVPGQASHLPPGVFDVSKSQDGGQIAGPSAEVLKTLTEAQLRALEDVKKNMTPEQAQQFQWRLDYQRSLNNPYMQRR